MRVRGGTIARWLLALAGVCWAVTSVAAVTVNGVRVWHGPDSARLVFDISDTVAHKVFTLAAPDRVVIDLRDARLSTSLDGLNLGDTPIARIRSGVRNGNDLRVVLDLRNGVKPRTSLLKPNREYGHRLVIDLDRAGISYQPMKKSPPVRPSGLRSIVIAVDAGHGGEDPGARGRAGTREKDVVLEISRRLTGLLKKEPGFTPVLIRDGDYYLGLRERMAKAREHEADLFVSIHADAFRDPRARGSSVFTVSEKGASSEAARWLADRENASDLIGGVTLDGRDDVLASVLLDLAQTASKDASHRVAANVLGGLKRVGHVHSSKVQRAGFVVLKSPDVPSILVETAFISNPDEERKLRSASYQQQLAEAIVDGIKAYFMENPPPGTVLADKRQHVIARGETLSVIAQLYRVSVGRLRTVNRLNGDVIQVGDVLDIPPSDS